MNEKKSRQRILSIDALRGITILVMIFVNELAGIRDIPQWAKHMPADADAMTFVDIVFPAFLFIVGMSVPFAVKNRIAKGDSTGKLLLHIGFRTLGLLVLGLFMVNAESGMDEQLTGMRGQVWALLFYACVILVWNVYTFQQVAIGYVLRGIGAAGLVWLAIIFRGSDGGGMQVHWWGILGLIGWAYLFTSLFYLVLKGAKAGIAGAIICCLLFYMAGKWPVVQEMPLIGWISGQTGHAVHTAIALCGLLLSLIYFDDKAGVVLAKRVQQAAVFTLVLLVAAFALRPYYTISKIWATPSWAFYSAAICCILYTAVYWVTDIKGHNRWTVFLRPAAANPLLTYIIPSILYYIMSLSGFGLYPNSWRSGLLGAVCCLVYALLIMGLVKLLNRAGIRLQL